MGLPEPRRWLAAAFVLASSCIMGLTQPTDAATNQDWDITVLPAPSELSLLGAGSSNLMLQWKDHAEGEEGFAIEISSDGGSTWSSAGSAPASPGVNGMVIGQASGLNPSTGYQVRVRALKDTVASAPTAPLAGTTSAGVPLTAATGIRTVVRSNTEISLYWLDNSTGESRYVLIPFLDGQRLSPIDVLANAAEFHHRNLQPGRTYQFVVDARSAQAVRAPSERVTASTIATNPDEPVTAPTGLVAEALSYGSVRLSWTDQSDNEVRFVVQRRATSDPTWQDVVSTRPNDTSAVDRVGLAPDTEYAYRLVAVNEFRESEDTPQVIVTTPPGVALQAPVITQASPREEGALLRWSIELAPDESVSVFIGLTPDFMPHLGNRIASGVRSQFYEVMGLETGQTYYFRIAIEKLLPSETVEADPLSPASPAIQIHTAESPEPDVRR